MNKNEVTELRRAIYKSDANFVINKLIVAVTDRGGKIKCQKLISRFDMSDYEEKVYINILKKVLNTKIGVNLTEYEFPNDSYAEGHSQNILYTLMRDGATDSAVEAYLDRLTDSYIYESSYAIITAHCTYTVFSKNNNDEIDKYNTEDFKFLLTAFCPIVNGYDSLSVELNVGSLGSEVNTTTYIANKPTGGFLYPAFNNRSSDINHIMVYDEKADVNIRFVDNFLECTSRVPAKVEKSQFHCLIKLLVGDDLSYELIIAINESLIDEINVHKNETEPCLVGEYELRTLLYDVFHMYGVDQNFDRFESIYNSVFGADTKVMISNLVDSKYVINIAGNKVSLSRLGEVAIESYTVVDTVRKRLVININEPSYTVNDYNILK